MKAPRPLASALACLLIAGSATAAEPVPATQILALPASPLFMPVIADPKTPRFFVSLREYRSELEAHRIGAVGYGESFNFLRWQSPGTNTQWQFGLDGGVFAQFDMLADSMDLINADYTIGFPATFRNGDLSGRIRLYHQSSHLGDEFLINNNPERVNLSYESLEILGSWDIGNWRLFGGGEYLLNREPENLDRGATHFGLELRQPNMLGRMGHLVAGVSAKTFEEHDWDTSTSLKGGVELARSPEYGRRVRFLLELYRGFSPHGQFYDIRVEYYGLAFEVGL